MENKSNTINGDIYYCRRLRILSYLIQNGFKPITSYPDKYEPRITIQAFVNTPELRKALDEWHNRTEKN